KKKGYVNGTELSSRREVITQSYRELPVTQHYSVSSGTRGRLLAPQKEIQRTQQQQIWRGAQDRDPRPRAPPGTDYGHDNRDKGDQRSDWSARSAHRRSGDLLRRQFASHAHVSRERDYPGKHSAK